MRITGGEWRSRVLQVPQDQTITRPTMDQTRQAVFNILNSAAWAAKPNGQSLLLDATVLDVFAGTGAYGFEALSRGAAHVTFVDKDAQAIQAIQKNIDQFKCAQKTKVIRTDVMQLGVNPGRPVTLCFLDPPYADEGWPDVIARLQAQEWIDEHSLIILEAGSKMQRETMVLVETTMELADSRQYGKSFVVFAKINRKI